ncbi:hypothetical protein HPB50_013693 [Hyalomma asiaticum]|uniref:Uncharacterized protein n=1 Tax=Hyalomma asiaticum TaxID=266040 RepID=A0ACB7RW82_HYAAI|nr:hypothetical protein HPB50_013693 [Hyalomma asiaticum]
METRFAHFNPDKCKMSRIGDAGDGEGVGSETTVTEEAGSQSEMDLLKMKIRLRELELQIAREQRGSGQSSRVVGGQESRSELRHFSKLIASVLPKFPTEAEVPVWFEAAESALDAHEDPKVWWDAEGKNSGSKLNECKTTEASSERLQKQVKLLPQQDSRKALIPEGKRQPGVVADIKETLPVLCTLTDKLVERTDCLLSEEAWRMLKGGNEPQGIVSSGERAANPEQMQSEALD